MKKPGKSSGRLPPDDDEALWRLAAETVEPLKRGKQRVHPAAEKNSAADKTQLPKAPANVTGNRHPKATPAPALPAAPKPAKAPEIAGFDRKAIRKIRRGSAAIEARIDLHGMRQDEAHAALRRFIQRAVSDGNRWVLVITGKGKSSRRSDVDFTVEVERDRGVLRRNVPRWLAEPDLRPFVVSYTTAAIQHGGDGALYLHLRTRQR